MIDMSDEIVKRRERIISDTGFIDFNKKLNVIYSLMQSIIENIEVKKYILNIEYQYTNKNIGLDLIKSGLSTLLSIHECLSLGNVADAFALTRKFNEDILLFVYFVKASKESVEPINKKARIAKENTSKWIDNQLSKLYIKEICDYLGEGDPKLGNLMPSENMIKKIDNNESIEQLSDIPSSVNNYLKRNGSRDNDNNFVHTNGMAFARCNHFQAESKSLNMLYNRIHEELTYYIKSFIELLKIIRPELLLIKNDSDDKQAILPNIVKFSNIL